MEELARAVSNIRERAEEGDVDLEGVEFGDIVHEKEFYSPVICPEYEDLVGEDEREILEKYAFTSTVYPMPLEDISVLVELLEEEDVWDELRDEHLIENPDYEHRGIHYPREDGEGVKAAVLIHQTERDAFDSELMPNDIRVVGGYFDPGVDTGRKVVDDDMQDELEAEEIREELMDEMPDEMMERVEDEISEHELRSV